MMKKTWLLFCIHCSDNKEKSTPDEEVTYAEIQKKVPAQEVVVMTDNELYVPSTF